MSPDLTDDLTTRLTEQMRAATASDALPPGLAGRVQRGVRRSRARRAAVAGTALAVAGVALASSLVADRPGGSREVVAAPVAEAPAGMVGPTDEELVAAQWFHYESVPTQPGTARDPESRWEGRDGRHLALQPDGTLELYGTDSRFSFGADGATWDELLALPADVDVLAAELAQGPGQRPDPERALDQVRYLLARSPALLEVRRALFDVAAGLDGATVERGQDERGRPADVLRLTDSDGAVQELYVDPVGRRALQERTVAGPDFPTPPTEAPAPPDPDAPPEEPAPEYEPDQVLYSEVFERWSTEAPPAS